MRRTPHAGLVERFTDDPGRARVTLVVSTELGEGMRCETTARGHAVAADEPRSFGGTDSAQSPVEMLLSSLATCQAITYRLWANELGIALDRIEVEVAGDLDLRGYLGMAEDAPAGYGSLRVRVGLTGPETAERYGELAEAVDAHCPVLDVLARPIPIERELVVSAGG
jgi:uncharacterized OsmC-like protein